MCTRSNRLAREIQVTCSDWCPGWRLADSPIAQPMYIWTVQGLRSGRWTTAAAAAAATTGTGGWLGGVVFKWVSAGTSSLAPGPLQQKQATITKFVFTRYREKRKTSEPEPDEPLEFTGCWKDIWLWELHCEKVNVSFSSRELNLLNKFFNLSELYFNMEQNSDRRQTVQIHKNCNICKQKDLVILKGCRIWCITSHSHRAQSVSPQGCSIFILKSCNLNGCWGDLSSVVCQTVWFTVFSALNCYVGLLCDLHCGAMT